MKKTLAKVIDILGVVASIIFIILCVVIIYFSLSYYNKLAPSLRGIEQISFFVGLTAAIVTTFAEWIWSRVIWLIKFFNRNKKNKQKGVKNGRRTKKESN